MQNEEKNEVRLLSFICYCINDTSDCVTQTFIITQLSEKLDCDWSVMTVWGLCLNQWHTAHRGSDHPVSFFILWKEHVVYLFRVMILKWQCQINPTSASYICVDVLNSTDESLKSVYRNLFTHPTLTHTTVFNLRPPGYNLHTHTNNVHFWRIFPIRCLHHLTFWIILKVNPRVSFTTPQCVLEKSTHLHWGLLMCQFSLKAWWTWICTLNDWQE